MDLANISHHGAVNGVTGSCHELHIDSDNSILIDCGLFQGGETSAYVECEIKALSMAQNSGSRKQKVIFSDDLGVPYTPLLPAPKAP